ncbi:D-glycerate dehydrogenase, partial [Xanthomonas perforans]
STRRAMVQLAVDNLIAALGKGPHAGNPPSALNADAVAATKRGGTGVDAKKNGVTGSISTKR